LSTLNDIKDFFSSAIKLTVDRIRLVKSAKREEPHVKLFIIDMINFLMGLLAHEDRRMLISELYEM